MKPDLVKTILAIEPTGLLHGDAIGGNGNLLNQTIASLPLSYGVEENSGGSCSSKPCLRVTAIQAGPQELQQCALQSEPVCWLTKLSTVPVVLVTAEASYHAVFDRGTVEFLRQAGVSVDWLCLELEGIHGNGHMMFMEKNSDEIADLLHRRILGIINEQNRNRDFLGVKA